MSAWTRSSRRALRRIALACGAASPWLAASTLLATHGDARASTHVETQAASPAPNATRAAPHWSLFGTIEPPFAVANQVFIDLDGRAGAEMCVVGLAGEVRSVRHADGRRGLAPEVRGGLVLSDPSHTVIALARMSAGAGPAELVAASPHGVELFRPDADGILRGESVPLLPRTRFRLRVGAPTLADIVQDVNGDGRNDLVLPAGEKLELWIQQPSGSASARDTTNSDDHASADEHARDKSSAKDATGASEPSNTSRDASGDTSSANGKSSADKANAADEASATDRANATDKSRGSDKALATPQFRRAASVRVPVSSSRDTDANELSDVLAFELSIPRLTMQDVNGDGRPDLCVKDGDVRAFHLVAADGSIRERPDVSVDLALFRDTTPEAEIKPGRTLAGGEKQHYEVRDLDADGIPDYVIAHRRKVWVFHGTKNGPQFTEPSTILKADDDVTGLVLADLDADKLPDLVLFKVQVPSIASILRGLVQEWEVEIDAAGYKNLAGKTFDTKPAWKNALYLRLPSILSIVRDPQALLHRFEEVGRKFRRPTEADFDGDGRKDLALVSEDGAMLEMWMGRERSPQTERESNEALLRKFVFDDPEHVWDLDRVIAFMGGYAQRRTQLLTGDRPSDARVELRAPSEFDLSGVYASDVDGDGRAEIVLRYLRRSDNVILYDVWGLE
jgi:hypothetical protein